MSKNWFFFKKKILIFFSIKSFNDVEIWIKNLRDNSSPDIKIILIGNKCDLDDRVVSKEDGEKLKNDYDFDYFIETSAKTGFNAKKLFLLASKILLEDYEKYNNDYKNNDNQNLKIENNKNDNNEKKKCCSK
jgi:GTPase SAR1 family protein